MSYGPRFMCIMSPVERCCLRCFGARILLCCVHESRYLVVTSLNDCLRGMFFVLILAPAESTAAYTEVTKSYQTACEQLAAVENIQRQLDTSSNHELAKQVRVWVLVMHSPWGWG